MLSSYSPIKAPELVTDVAWLELIHRSIVVSDPSYSARVAIIYHFWFNTVAVLTMLTLSVASSKMVDSTVESFRSKRVYRSSNGFLAGVPPVVTDFFYFENNTCY